MGVFMQITTKTLSFSYHQFMKHALELWSNKAIDPQDGDFLEYLSFDGQVIFEQFRRGRVQARQIYTLAMAIDQGHDNQENHLLKTAQKAYSQGLPHYQYDNMLAFSRNVHDDAKDSHCFAYEQAFLIMAAAMLYQVTEEQKYADDAERIWQWLQANLYDETYDGFQVAQSKEKQDPRQQNPHMHLFEACMVAMQYIDQKQWQPRAAWLFGLFEKYFFDANEGCLREFFHYDWSYHQASGDRLDPGHHFEWVWLLWQYEKLTKTHTYSYRAKLFDYGVSYGLNPNGFGKDEIYPKGKELRSTSRLWVQCELLKAHMAMGFYHQGRILLQKIFDSYLFCDRGTWYDQLDEQGQNISDNSPASTFYHIFIALSEAKALINKGI